MPKLIEELSGRQSGTGSSSCLEIECDSWCVVKTLQRWNTGKMFFHLNFGLKKKKRLFFFVLDRFLTCRPWCFLIPWWALTLKQHRMWAEAGVDKRWKSITSTALSWRQQHARNPMEPAHKLNCCCTGFKHSAASKYLHTHCNLTSVHLQTLHGASPDGTCLQTAATPPNQLEPV